MNQRLALCWVLAGVLGAVSVAAAPLLVVANVGTRTSVVSYGGSTILYPKPTVHLQCPPVPWIHCTSRVNGNQVLINVMQDQHVENTEPEDKNAKERLSVEDRFSVGNSRLWGTKPDRMLNEGNAHESEDKPKEDERDDNGFPNNMHEVEEESSHDYDYGNGNHEENDRENDYGYDNNENNGNTYYNDEHEGNGEVNMNDDNGNDHGNDNGDNDSGDANEDGYENHNVNDEDNEDDDHTEIIGNADNDNNGHDIDNFTSNEGYDEGTSKENDTINSKENEVEESTEQPKEKKKESKGIFDLWGK